MSNPALRLCLFHFENPGCSLGCFCVKRRRQPVWFLLLSSFFLDQHSSLCPALSCWHHKLLLSSVSLCACVLIHLLFNSFAKPVDFSVAHFLASPFLCWAHPGHYVNASVAANLHRCKKKKVFCAQPVIYHKQQIVFYVKQFLKADTNPIFWFCLHIRGMERWIQVCPRSWI